MKKRGSWKNRLMAFLACAALVAGPVGCSKEDLSADLTRQEDSSDKGAGDALLEEASGSTLPDYGEYLKQNGFESQAGPAFPGSSIAIPAAAYQRPALVEQFDWQTAFVFDCRAEYPSPLYFYLSEGSHTITLRLKQEALALGEIFTCTASRTGRICSSWLTRWKKRRISRLPGKGSIRRNAGTWKPEPSPPRRHTASGMGRLI